MIERRGGAAEQWPKTSVVVELKIVGRHKQSSCGTAGETSDVYLHSDDPPCRMRREHYIQHVNPSLQYSRNILQRLR